MKARQRIPDQLLIVAESSGANWKAAENLPRGSGILLIAALKAKEQRRLRNLARVRSLTIFVEGRRGAVRVHNLRELTRARLRRNSVILLSPLYQTKSHVDWIPLPRMRAASLARLANRQAIALGGMNPKRHAKVAALGFIGWAGISAFRT